MPDEGMRIEDPRTGFLERDRGVDPDHQVTLPPMQAIAQDPIRLAARPGVQVQTVAIGMASEDPAALSHQRLDANLGEPACHGSDVPPSSGGCDFAPTLAPTGGPD